MSISWLTDDSKTQAKWASSTSVLKKINGSKSDSGGHPSNIICGSEAVARKLISAMDKLNFDFPTLNLRFGWIKNESEDFIELPSGGNLIVGQDKHIDKYLKAPNVKLLHISRHCRGEATHLAYQRHFTSDVNLNSISIGEMREDLSDSGTLMRTAETIHFHIDAIRFEDSRSEHSPVAGLDIYRTCKLMRLAGLSTRLQLLAINTAEGAISDRTADLISTMIWYYLEGQINKEIETMKQKENDIFLVSSKLFEEPIKFVVGHTTGRWWYQHPSTKEYLPCSDKDYKAISMGNLPEAIVSLQH